MTELWDANDGNHRFLLLNAHEQHQRHPDTFWVPDASDLAPIAVGDFAKLTFNADGYAPERMWVEIEEMDEGWSGEIVGKLVNVPVQARIRGDAPPWPDGLDYGGTVLFLKRHVLMVMTREEMHREAAK